MAKKYEILQEDTVKVAGKTLYRIRALKDLRSPWDGRSVKAGQLGGFIEQESNLSQKGNCWVADKAKVFGKARVEADFWVWGSAEVDSSMKFVTGFIGDDAVVTGKASVHSSEVKGSCRVEGNARILSSVVTGRSLVSGSAVVQDNSTIMAGSVIQGDSAITHTVVTGDSVVDGKSLVVDSRLDNCQIQGSEIFGKKLTRKNLTDYRSRDHKFATIGDAFEDLDAAVQDFADNPKLGVAWVELLTRIEKHSDKKFNKGASVRQVVNASFQRAKPAALSGIMADLSNLNNLGYLETKLPEILVMADEYLH